MKNYIYLHVLQIFLENSKSLSLKVLLLLHSFSPLSPWASNYTYVESPLCPHVLSRSFLHFHTVVCDSDYIFSSNLSSTSLQIYCYTYLLCY